MSLIVKKFGGTSLGSVDKIKNAAVIVANEIEKGNKVIVVASAMAGVTDQLVSISKDVANCEHISQQMEYDAIIATGEKVSSGLFALALQSTGYKARSWQGWQIPIKTNGAYSNSKIVSINAELLESAVANDEVPVITGFQGVFKDRVTTLGRGGSDTTAAAIASSLQADRCDIYTDVDGIYSADPNQIPKAKKISQISYEEVLELADAGAKVLHPRCVEIAARHGLNLQVKSTFKPDNPGTIITKEYSMEKASITAIAQDNSLCGIKIDASPSASTLANIHFTASEANYAISSLQVLGSSFLMLIPKNSLKAAQNSLKDKHFILSIMPEVSLISIIGTGLKTDSEVLPRILEILSRYQMNILSLTTSATRISILTEHADSNIIQQLHTALGLDKAL